MFCLAGPYLSKFPGVDLVCSHMKRLTRANQTRDFLLNDPKRRHLPMSAYKALQNETIFRNAESTSHMSTKSVDLSNIKTYLRFCGLDPSLAELDDLDCRPSSAAHKRAMQELARYASSANSTTENPGTTQQDPVGPPNLTSNSSASPSDVTTRPTSATPSSPGKQAQPPKRWDDSRSR